MSTMDSIAARARNGERLDDVPIIDAHGHLGRWYQFPTHLASAEAVLRTMDRVGINTLCVSGHVSAAGVDFVRGNDECMNAMQQYPGRFFAYITVYPNHPDGVLQEIQRCEAGGLRALKIHSYHGKPYNAPEYQPAYERANEMGYPVLAHTWGKELAEIREMAQQYPRINWLLAHSGVNQWDDYVKIAKDFDNVYLEICTSLTGYRWVERFIKEVGAHKVLFGSDVAFLSVTQQLGRVALANITEEEKRQVLGLNAKRIFNL